MTILRHPSLPEVEPKPLRFTFGCKFVAESFPSLPRITGPLGDDEEDAAQKWNDWVRPLWQAVEDAREFKNEAASLAEHLAASRAEVERLRRELAEVEGYPGIAHDMETLRADLAAANARAERIQAGTVGWMYAYACNCADRGVDIRKIEAPLILDQCQAALNDQPEQPT